MARSVQIFKDTGLKARELASEAEAARSQTEAERLRSEEADRKRAAEMAQATSSLAEGLERLSDGDLGFQLSTPFASDFENLRANFNTAVDKLRRTLGAVAQATGAIDGGSRELSQSASDLSKRTEQQAASLEETAAPSTRSPPTCRTPRSARKRPQRCDEGNRIGQEVGRGCRQCGRCHAADRKLVEPDLQHHWRDR